jgi:hypothetical protein
MPLLTRRRAAVDLPSRWLVCLALLLAAGCGAHGTAPLTSTGTPAPAVAFTAAPALPAPGSFKRPSKIIVNVLNGSDFSAQPSLGAVAVGSEASLTPLGTAPAVACAVYTLEPDVASVAPLLHLAWRTAPQAGQCWIGLGDFTRGVWTWQQWTAGQDTALDLQTLNISPTGAVPVAVVLTGAAAAQLGRVRIGANQPPQVTLNLTAPQGPAPVSLTADASATYDPDGLIVKYEYDLDGDGTFDQTTTQPIVHWQQATDGSYQVYLRVTDDEGASGSAVVDYDTGYHHSWAPLSGPSNVVLTGISASPAGGFFALGYAVLPPGGTKLTVVLFKYDTDGTLAWVQALGNSSESNISGAVQSDLAGGAYVSSTMTVAGGGGTELVAHYLSDGSIDWQRSWGGSNVYLQRGAGLAVDYADNLLYVAFGYLVSANNHVAVLQSYGTDGAWNWTRGWSGGSDTYTAGCGVDALGNAYLSALFQQGSYLQTAVVQFDDQGTQESKVQCGSTTFGLQANGMAVNASGGVALVGEYMDPSNFGPFALVMSSGFTPDYAYYLPNQNAEDSFAGCKFSQADGRLWACGTLADTPDMEGALMVFAPNGFNRQLYRFDAPGGKVQFAGVDLPAGGGVLYAGEVSGPTVIDPTDRDSLTLTYNVSIPAPNALPDPSQPQVSTYPSVPATGDPTSPGGAIVSRFYQPLE